MPFTRSLLLLVCCSLLAGAVLWVLVPGARPSPVRSGGYAALVTDSAVPDAELRELLASAQGDFAGPPVSESSQWALLDVFSGVERIPLDEYGSRVTPFDPRNDGYAEKLRSCFVRDGKRFVFIPRKPGASAGTLEKSLASALGAIPFSVEYRSLGTPLGFYALLFAAASALLFLPRLGRFFRRGRGGGFDAGWALPCLPVLASLALCGAPGFALSALLLGLSAALEEPVFAWRAPRRIRGGVFEPFRRRWLAAPLFPAGLALVVLVSGISPLLALGAFAAYAGIFVCSIRTFSLPRSGGHVRFVPLPIIRHPRSSGFPAAGKAAPVMLPFALAAILAAFLSPFLSGVRAWGGNSVQGTGAFAAAGLVTEADYRAHAAFQASFSRRPLGEPSIPGEGRLYPAYTRDSGGLISPAVPPRQTAQETEFPPFPLQALVEFMGAAGANGGWTVPFGGFPAGDLAAALLPLLFIIPGLSIKRGKIPAIQSIKNKISWRHGRETIQQTER